VLCSRFPSCLSALALHPVLRRAFGVLPLAVGVAGGVDGGALGAGHKLGEILGKISWHSRLETVGSAYGSNK